MVIDNKGKLPLHLVGQSASQKNRGKSEDIIKLLKSKMPEDDDQGGELQKFDWFHGEISRQSAYALSFPAGGRNVWACLTTTASSQDVVGVRALSCYQHWHYVWILTGFCLSCAFGSTLSLSMAALRNETNLLVLRTLTHGESRGQQYPSPPSPAIPRNVRLCP